MTALFADTFYWVALADFADSAHQRALALTADRASSRVVTTDEVLTEGGGAAAAGRPYLQPFRRGGSGAQPPDTVI